MATTKPQQGGSTTPTQQPAQTQGSTPQQQAGQPIFRDWASI